jgi:hypothetical protein
MTELRTLSAQLNDARAKIDKALMAETALGWLQAYGPKTVPARDSIASTVSQNTASACVGAKEARQYLEAAAQEFFPEINRRAIEVAQQDIDAGKSALTSGKGT